MRTEMFNEVLKELAEKFVKDNSQTLSKVESKVSPILKEVDKLFIQLKKTPENHISAIREIGTKMCAYYKSLKRIADDLHALRHNKRVAFFYLRASDYENGRVLNDEGKVIKGSIEKIKAESELFIAKERQLYYRINSYVESLKSTISYCQTLIKSSEEQRKLDLDEE